MLRSPQGPAWLELEQCKGGRQELESQGLGRGCGFDGHHRRMTAPSSRRLGPPQGGLPPDSPGAEHSRAASSTKPRPFMAAGSMLQTGLGKTQGLRAGVLWGAGLARRSLGQQTQPSAEPEGPSLFLSSKCNLLAGTHRGSSGRLQSPTPSPSPRVSIITASPPARIGTTRDVPTPRPAPVGWGGEIGGASSLPWGAVGASGEKRAGQGASEQYLPMGGGASATSPPPPLGWGAWNPALRPLPSPALRASLRSPLIRAWSAGHESGAHSHPWGVDTPRLREARGSVPFGLPADRNPGAASSFGERSRRRGPRARGGAELGRGLAGAGAGAGAVGVVQGAPPALRSAPGRCPGPSCAPRQQAPA